MLGAVVDCESIFTYENGLLALQGIRQLMEENRELPSIIFLDINMPIINGYECTRQIKMERPDLPVIAQTAYAMSGEREVSRAAGCDDYLSKPIKVSELLDTLSKYI